MNRRFWRIYRQMLALPPLTLYGGPMTDYTFDENNVRYELVSDQLGEFNWLFLPGGPGVDSCYLHSLTELLDLPGKVWLVDMPGNGTNDVATNYDEWFDLLIPTVERFDNPIIVGHSFGGFWSLLYPALEEKLSGFILVNASPCLPMEASAEYAKQFDMPDVSSEYTSFMHSPSEETYKTFAEALLPYFFPPHTLERGRTVFLSAHRPVEITVWWQEQIEERDFATTWVPQAVPTLVLGGDRDLCCPFHLFTDDQRFQRDNITITLIKESAHFGWMEKPDAYKGAIEGFAKKL